jgi:hypothetical protein
MRIVCYEPNWKCRIKLNHKREKKESKRWGIRARALRLWMRTLIRIFWFIKRLPLPAGKIVKCKRCHKAYLKKTDDPRESKCEICDWSVLELTLYDLTTVTNRGINVTETIIIIYIIIHLIYIEYMYMF